MNDAIVSFTPLKIFERTKRDNFDDIIIYLFADLQIIFSLVQSSIWCNLLKKFPHLLNYYRLRKSSDNKFGNKLDSRMTV